MAKRGRTHSRRSRGQGPTRTGARPVQRRMDRVVVETSDGTARRRSVRRRGDLVLPDRMSVTYLEAIRAAQARALADDPRVFIYGQDVGAFGGAFKATKNLANEFPGRVIDSPISEDSMIGLAVGAAIEGLRPIVETQFAETGRASWRERGTRE